MRKMAETIHYLRQNYKQYVNIKFLNIFMLNSTILVSCSKAPRTQFERFNANRF